jgi:catechol 2,3-dioxygenase-like lactoylglutathione lyase family enzyme
MPVAGIDHINIVTEKLDETADFYAQLLGLSRGSPPGMAAASGFSGAWMFDETGAAIVHLVGYNADRYAAEGIVPGDATGSVHHVALRCHDFAGILARAEAMGAEPRVNDRRFGDLRQIFVLDPNNVRLELNFAGD